jgi:hypothetical protein
MPDVLGRDLERARAILDEAGYQVEVTETRTPREGQPRGVTLVGPQRVIRQRLADRLVRLVVTHERYVPAQSRPACDPAG